jgi:glucose/mannose-6-phosphate isomerase
MQNLDDLTEIKKLDKSGILGSIENLDKQVEQSWKELYSFEVPQSCTLSTKVVISGMGGSALGGRILDSLVADRVRTPIEVFTEFHLPRYVGPDTLVILSSYSGDTAETISSGYEALNRKATIFCITTGGQLGKFAIENKLNLYLIKPIHNPSNQPRMGLGYSITSILALLAKCQFIVLSEEEILGVLETIRTISAEFKVEVPEELNLAKKTARRLKAKIPVLIGSEHLIGSLHAFKNQLNENAKCFSVLFDIPELNHHLMEGLRNPVEAKKLLHFLFFESELYSNEVKIRYPLTREVVEKNFVESSIYKLRSEQKLRQIFEVLVFGSYVNFYLAMLYDIDPAPIPWVDFFKSKLANKII